MLDTLLALIVAAFTTDHALLLPLTAFVMTPLCIGAMVTGVAYPRPYSSTEKRALDGWGAVYTVLVAAVMLGCLGAILTAFAPYV